MSASPEKRSVELRTAKLQSAEKRSASAKKASASVVRKTVRFGDKLESVKIFERDMADAATDLVMAKDAVLHFLNSTVEDAVATHGKHMPSRKNKSPQSPVNNLYVSREFVKAIKEIAYSQNTTISEDVAEKIFNYIYENFDTRVSDFLKIAIDHPKNGIIMYAAAIVTRLGLKTFIEYNHCANKCHELMTFSKDLNDYSIRITADGRNHRSLRNMCTGAHDEIEKALLIDDIRKFDNILRIASSGKCSFVRAPYAGGSRKTNKTIHTGPRGGKYVIVNGKKQYV